MQTALYKSLDNARKDPDAGDEYINLFLNNEVFIPAWDDPEEATEDNKTEIRPLLTNNEEGEFIMGFDTKERLETWIDVAAGIASLKGFELLIMVKDQPVQICMNAGTPYIKIFTRDEITWLVKNAQIDES